MNDTTIILIIIAVAVAALSFMTGNKTANKKVKNENIDNSKKEPELYPYEKKNILTKAEYSFYMTIKPLCDKYNILICPKVRLEDIVDIKKGTENKLKYRGYIKSRHIDFILCDNKLHILAGLELDDNSHRDNTDQIKADNFKNKLFETIGVTLFRVKMSEGYYITQFNDILKTLGYIKEENVNDKPDTTETNS